MGGVCPILSQYCAKLRKVESNAKKNRDFSLHCSSEIYRFPRFFGISRVTSISRLTSIPRITSIPRVTSIPSIPMGLWPLAPYACPFDAFARQQVAYGHDPPPFHGWGGRCLHPRPLACGYEMPVVEVVAGVDGDGGVASFAAHKASQRDTSCWLAFVALG